MSDLRSKSPSNDIAGDDTHSEAIRLDSQKLKERKLNRTILVSATVVTSSFAVISFFFLLCTLRNFSKVYTYHNSIVVMSEGVNLMKFILLLIPAGLYSTVFVVSLVSCLRFVSSYASNTQKYETEMQQGENEAKNLAAFLSRLVSGNSS